MNIGIIVFSHTGNTLSLSREILKSLTKAGHTVNIEQVTTDGDPQKMGNDIKFKNRPSTDNYDALFFGSPVWAFSLCPVMKIYLSGLGSLDSRKVGLFVTKTLPFNWTGGNHAISQMKKEVGVKKGKVNGSGIVRWKKGGPDPNMDDIIQKLCKHF
ncbi:MAG: flavodoxin [Candidatus Thermoplasmatota archaeon]|nr:flavodoxin [Candidatus Thermoplasmatota archaeon]